MIKGLHIELTNKCTLKCPRCSRTQFIEQFPKKWTNTDINFKDLLEFIDIDITGLTMKLCGNYGDPIYYDELIELIRELKKRKANIELSTNGSYKSQEWWHQLAGVLTDSDRVIFGIDGVPENFTKYRVNADWSSMLTGITEMILSEAQVVWQYILFSYNLDTVEQARQLAEKLGFDHFETAESVRWDNKDDWLMPKSNSVSDKKVMWKGNKDLEIDALCKNNQKEHYISADGYYSPCCFIAEHNFYYKTDFYKKRDRYAIKNNTLSKILTSADTVSFYNSIEQEQPSVCTFNCPKVEHGI